MKQNEEIKKEEVEETKDIESEIEPNIKLNTIRVETLDVSSTSTGIVKRDKNEIKEDIKEINKEAKIGSTISQPSNIDVLLAKIEALENKDIENQEKLKMLYDVADKGRVFNYESNRAEKKPFKVKLSVFQGGIIIGWRTLKDELIKHPTTGLTIGESQEYELLIMKDNNTEPVKFTVSGYPAFSNARYNERIEADVIGKKEDYNGNITFDLKLPDGKVVSLDSRFIN